MRLKNPFYSVKNYIMKLKGNARVCIAFHPLWGIPYSIYFFYLSLYMKAHGVTDSQLGFLMTAGFGASIVFSVAAAPLVDNLGRKKSTFIFDLLSSAIPPFIYAVSGSFWFAFAAIILNSANKVMSVAYYLVMIEDADDEQRMIAFNLFNIITIAAGVFIPVAGIFVERFGLVRTERFFLIFSGISMTLLISVRNYFLKETKAGIEILEKRNGGNFSVKDIVKPYANSYKYLVVHPHALITVIANVIFYVYYMIGTNNSLYFAPYFIDGPSLDPADISLLGAFYSAGMLFAMIIINPLMQRINIFLNLITGAVVNITGLILLVVIPGKNLTAAIAAAVMTSVGFGILKSVMDAALAITTEGRARAGIYSISNLMSSIFGMLIAGLAGILYPVNPGSVYIM
ncbi:MAG: MFS transporter, partial [Clostridiaceae bacterium]|nr:MFS transporter [Clostridiaceae bacterium]